MWKLGGHQRHGVSCTPRMGACRRAGGKGVRKRLVGRLSLNTRGSRCMSGALLLPQPGRSCRGAQRPQEETRVAPLSGSVLSSEHRSAVAHVVQGPSTYCAGWPSLNAAAEPRSGGPRDHRASGELRAQSLGVSTHVSLHPTSVSGAVLHQPGQWVSAAGCQLACGLKG